MGVYSNLPKLSRVKLPSGTTYALVDYDGRAMLAEIYSTAGSYAPGDYVVYNDELWRCTGSTTGEWDNTKWENITVGSELKSIKNAIANGIHYAGYTSTSLYENATTNPITINNSSYTAISGDLVIENPPVYSTNTAYVKGQYVSYNSLYYQVTENISAANNTSWSAVKTKLVANEPEFIFDGTQWNEIGALNPAALGALAYKNTASGSYTAPTGSGSVTINTYTPSTKSLSTTTITGTNGTVSTSEVSVKTTKAFAIRNISATTVAVADADTTRVGNADVDTAVAVGTSLTGTTEFNTDAIKAAELTGTTTFNTDAIKAAELTGDKTFTLSGVNVNVESDCLTFTNASTGTVGISTTVASTGTVGISTTAASTGTVSLGTTNITPAKAVDASSTTVRGVSGTTDIYGTSGTDTAITELNITAKTAAVAASSATTVATGSLESGNQLVTGITEGSTSANVTVFTEQATVTVQ